MNFLKKILLGDKYLIAFIMFLAFFSLLPGLSASSNIEYAAKTGTVWGQFGRQLSFMIVGIVFMFAMQLVNYKALYPISVISFVVIIPMLAYTLSQGIVIDGAGASRWIKLPGIPITIQTSTFASLALMIFIAGYLTAIRNKKITFKNIWLPALITLGIIGLIFPANGSTAIILFCMVMVILFIGGFPLKYLISLGSIIVLLGGLFIFVALNYGDAIPNSRVHTWKNRIERFNNPSENSLESWQETNAKAAIVEGGFFGKGPGKSAIKHTLPQASSDFIFAVIVEEYGLFGGITVLFIYISILFRIVLIATKIEDFFGSLLVFAVGLPIIFQALINTGVAVGLFPTTGQPLPMISYGGTSLWVTCISFGIILSVSRHIPKKEETNENLTELNDLPHETV
ncbi:cell division protein FtsW [Ornithobacterium rhinotracheale]|uniref:FtsW/RodA/SpoVE family cell cycle protein n=1 Tax=Ornithobacterium rhinotracheale TaxID=28251 RepID=UPI00129D0298|nr:FtsW/RodA/SpoVE family cell cycle protein [Ornithobacterium rhinotracheale]MRJ09997.1 cell division protein FtsW [Ornithobacterium rhinotracheale]